MKFFEYLPVSFLRTILNNFGELSKRKFNNGWIYKIWPIGRIEWKNRKEYPYQHKSSAIYMII